VDIRASQINGCAFCLDMHVKAATIHGERRLRLHHIAAWRESTLFDPRERAQLSEKELSDLTFRRGEIPRGGVAMDDGSRRCGTAVEGKRAADRHSRESQHSIIVRPMSRDIHAAHSQSRDRFS